MIMVQFDPDGRAPAGGWASAPPQTIQRRRRRRRWGGWGARWWRSSPTASGTHSYPIIGSYKLLHVALYPSSYQNFLHITMKKVLIGKSIFEIELSAYQNAESFEFCL